MYFKFSEMFPLERINELVFLVFVFDCLIFTYIIAVNYKRFGVFSITTYWMFFSFFLGILSQFFFAFSYLNQYSSPAIFSYSKLTNQTFLICSLGLYCFIFGAFLSYRIKYNLIGFNFVYDGVLGFCNSKKLYALSLSILLFCVFMFIYLDVPFGQGRQFSMENPIVRPIVNFVNSLFYFFLLLYIIAAMSNRHKKYYFIVFLLVFLTLWSGTRSSLLTPIIISLAILSMSNNSKNIFKYFFYGVIVLSLLIIIKFIRDSLTDSFNIESVLLEMFFGNTFSDLRDFTWVYYYWDGEYLYGKTMLAGMISFIPSFISDFREVWSWGRWSTNITNLNPLLHPGLRPTVFGESFFNFGIIGVMLMGFILGCVSGRLDKMILSVRKNPENDKKVIIMFIGACFIYFSVFTTITISAGYFNTYIRIFFLMFGVIAFRVKPRRIVFRMGR